MERASDVAATWARELARDRAERRAWALAWARYIAAHEPTRGAGLPPLRTLPLAVVLAEDLDRPAGRR